MKSRTTVPGRLNRDFFGRLPAKRRRFLVSTLKRVEYAPGTSIIRQGRSGQFLGILESGQVVLENGHKKTRTLSRGDYFGQEMLRAGKPSDFTVTTRSETVLWVLNRSDWLAPSPQNGSGTNITKKPRLKKKSWIILVSILSITMILFTLGSILIDTANNSLPDFLVRAGQADLAESYLNFVISWQPESARVYGNLGDILVLQNKAEQAIEAYQQALSIDEYLPWIHNNLGVSLLEQGAADLAADHFLKALNLNPQNTDAYRNLGNAYYAQGQWQAAANAYQFALDLDPSLMETRADWAGLNLYGHQLDEARLAWEEILLENPRHLMALQGLGVISLLELDPSRALLYLDAARYVDPQNANTRLYLGLVLEALDRPEDAAAEYKYIVDLGSDPDLNSLADTLLSVVMD